ncbi:alpha/beta hydrolase [Pseudonocardiaceae bacterium YIM PH 21723]|nr:alpha/beta hydrolase [Pseudonocardiaceae bacterium YIM PH 21723]
MLKRLAAAVAVITGAALIPAATPAIAQPTTCQEVTYPVTVPGATGQFIAGTLCKPQGATRLQILVHGGTYNQAYWEYRPEGAPSFREAMNEAGIATLNIDRVGSGRSSKPLSALILADVAAGAIHQVIQQVRPGFAKVVLVSHSIGTAFARIEAATYRDVDGLVNTGLPHLVKPVPAALLLSTLRPVQVARAGQARAKAWGADVGYLTTAPGTRYRDFHTPSVEPQAAIDYDEANWDVVDPVEVLGAVVEVVPGTTRSTLITASVLMVMGERDSLFCGPGLLSTACTSSAALKRAEQGYFPSARSFDAYVVPGTGHSINFGTRSPEQYPVISGWTNGL